MADLDDAALARRLDRIAAWVRPADDGLLSLAAALGRSGAGVGLGLIVDGLLVTGAIGPQRFFADTLWEATDEALEEMGLEATTRAQYAEVWSQILDLDEERRRRDDELMEKYAHDVELEDVELGDAYEVSRLRLPDPAIDLHDVQLHVVPGAEPVGLSTMRVNLSKVSAWWPLKAQGVRVTYSSAGPDS